VLFQLLIPGLIPVLLLESNQGLKLASDEKKIQPTFSLLAQYLVLMLLIFCRFQSNKKKCIRYSTS
jgi:hypothetical protein